MYVSLIDEYIALYKYEAVKRSRNKTIIIMIVFLINEKYLFLVEIILL